MKTFVGGIQWLVFFLIGLVINFIIIPIVTYEYIGFSLGIALGAVIFTLVSAFALIKGYRFFYNNPLCMDYSGKIFLLFPLIMRLFY